MTNLAKIYAEASVEIPGEIYAEAHVKIWVGFRVSPKAQGHKGAASQMICDTAVRPLGPGAQGGGVRNPLVLGPRTPSICDADVRPQGPRAHGGGFANVWFLGPEPKSLWESEGSKSPWGGRIRHPMGGGEREGQWRGANGDERSKSATATGGLVDR